jgi:hypothetical protein
VSMGEGHICERQRPIHLQELYAERERPEWTDKIQIKICTRHPVTGDVDRVSGCHAGKMATNSCARIAAIGWSGKDT